MIQIVVISKVCKDFREKFSALITQTTVKRKKLNTFEGFPND